MCGRAEDGGLGHWMSGVQVLRRLCVNTKGRRTGDPLCRRSVSTSHPTIETPDSNVMYAMQRKGQSLKHSYENRMTDTMVGQADTCVFQGRDAA